MILDDKILESKFFPDAHLAIAGYFRGLQQDMLERNDDLIQTGHSIPEFELLVEPKR
ncbi:MAG TPA: hypothetical protein VM010_02820 [Chitinophagaceae bacterium]|nr:hypothetical protein [Chitinophagaceae bacterium]